MAVDAAARYLNICRKQAEYEAAQLQERGVIVTPRQITLATIHGYNKGPYHSKDANQDSPFSFTGRGKWDYPGRAEENFYRLGGTEREFDSAFSFGKSLARNKRSITMNWFRDTLHPALQKSSFSGIKEKSSMRKTGSSGKYTRKRLTKINTGLSIQKITTSGNMKTRCSR